MTLVRCNYQRANRLDITARRRERRKTFFSSGFVDIAPPLTENNFSSHNHQVQTDISVTLL
jgi:hypothetical protein